MEQSVIAPSSRRHPLWGIVAQTVGVLGITVLLLAAAVTWIGWGASDQAVGTLVGDLDTAATDAIATAEEVAVALEKEAGTATDPETAQVLRDGAALTRALQTRVSDIDRQVGDLSGTTRFVLLVVTGTATGLLIYLILIHAAVWTLGRHWRRD